MKALVSTLPDHLNVTVQKGTCYLLMGSHVSLNLVIICTTHIPLPQVEILMNVMRCPTVTVTKSVPTLLDPILAVATWDMS